jgi:hypothetical protein
MGNDIHNISGGKIPVGVQEPTQILGSNGAVDYVPDRIYPSTALYVQPIDILHINLSAPSAGGTMLINYRLMLPDGTIQVAQETFNFSGGVGGQLKEIALIEGWLLSVTCQLRTANISVGEIYCEVYLIRQAPLNLVWPVQLIADYFTSFQTLGWPGNTLRQPTEGRGWNRYFSVGAPAAGVDFSVNLPQQFHWKLKGMFFDFTTSVAVANRTVRVRVGTNVLHISSGFVQTASQTIHYTFGEGMPYNSSDPTYGVTAPFPGELEWGCDAILTAGSEVGNIQAADQLSNIFLLTTQWHEND